MPTQLADSLVVFCVLGILIGVVFELNQQVRYGLPLILGGGVALGGVLTARSFGMKLATLVGFSLGAAIPVAWGSYGIAHDIAYREAHPGDGYCGMGLLLAECSILVGGPVCGAVEATVVTGSLAICRAVGRHAAPVPPYG